MHKLLLYASAVLVSFLPERYRRWWNFENSLEMRGAAIVCGLLQMAAGAVLYMALFLTQGNDIMGRTGALVLASQHDSMDPRQIRLATGVLGLANFALQPLHILIAYVAVEGAVRAIAAMAAREPLPTLALSVIGALHDRIDEARRKRELGPPINDVIQPPHDATYDVRVLSCRPKPEWNPYISVRFRDEFYVLAGEERGPKPRPYIYRLRKNPTGRLVVVIRDYRLDDPVVKAPYSGL
jgi:hypothetical protein